MNRYLINDQMELKWEKTGEEADCLKKTDNQILTEKTFCSKVEVSE